MVIILRTYRISIIILLLISGILRFWDFSHRLSLYSDAARDALVGYEAIKEHKLPLTGSFSSVGPFVFGPIFYYYIMFVYSLTGYVLAPWYGIALLSLLFVLTIIDIGQSIGGRIMGIIGGLLATFSPAQVFRSVALTQHSLVGIASAIAIWSAVRYWKSKKVMWLLILGIACGIAASLHYQALSLLTMGSLGFVIEWKKWKRIAFGIMLYGIGVLLPFTPLLWWDWHQQWANIRNFLDYLFIGQYRIFVSRRWLTFITAFLPKTWGSVIGGNEILGTIVILLTVIGCFYLIMRRRFQIILSWLIAIFSLLIITVRYFRGEIFEGYLLFIHPFILVLTTISLFAFLKINATRKATTLLLCTVTIFNFLSDIQIFSHKGNIVSEINKTIDTLTGLYPHSKFIPFDFQYNSTEFTYSLSLLLQSRGLIDPNGTPIGVCLWACTGFEEHQDITANYGGKMYDLIRLSGFSEDTLLRSQWFDLSPAHTLDEVGFWWKKKQLYSNFSLSRYMKNLLTQSLIRFQKK